ncbi:MAG: hypothetical protein FD163_1248 [Hyphomonadaceae bacterium]|nr:MAG: hypothetical protein FD128_1855 [Hyphomonadaceae bacterium]KAF0185433.1 MAG: hypothetical protein FD163_1248 [Hyphomonadaceae bacterium]
MTVEISIDINLRRELIAVPTLKVTLDRIHITDTPIQSFELMDKKCLIEALKVAILNGNPEIRSYKFNDSGYREELKLLKFETTKQFEREGLSISLTKEEAEWVITPMKRHFPRGFVPSDEERVILPISMPIEIVGSRIHDLILAKKAEWDHL